MNRAAVVTLDSICDALIEEIADVSEVHVERDTALLEANVLDSFAMLALVGLLEDMLSVNFDPDELATERFKSVTELAAWALGHSEVSSLPK